MALPAAFGASPAQADDDAEVPAHASAPDAIRGRWLVEGTGVASRLSLPSTAPVLDDSTGFGGRATLGYGLGRAWLGTANLDALAFGSGERALGASVGARVLLAPTLAVRPWIAYEAGARQITANGESAWGIEAVGVSLGIGFLPTSWLAFGPAAGLDAGPLVRSGDFYTRIWAGLSASVTLGQGQRRAVGTLEWPRL